MSSCAPLPTPPSPAPLRRKGARSSACLIQQSDGRGIQLETHSASQVVELLDAGGAGDRRSDAGSRDQPRECYPGGRRAQLLGYFVERVENAHATLVQVALHASSTRALGQVRLRAVFPGQESACEREIGDHADAFLAAERFELSFVLAALVQVVVRLQAFVAWVGVGVADPKRLRETLGAAIGRTDRPHFTLLGELRVGFERFLRRRLRVISV